MDALPKAEKEVTHRGSCHCGTVQFEVTAPEHIESLDCNCSICSKKGYIHLIVPKSKFRLISGENNLSCYTFNTGVAKHYFCKTCGISGFYIPRSNPDGYDINVRCLDKSTIKSVTIKEFDGQNWESNAGNLKELSQDK